MRVIRSVVSRRRHDDRAAVLILAAVFMLVAVVFLAFVVDIGNQRQDRRQFTTATDASALDVAQSWANAKLASTTYPGGDCSTAAQDYLERNRTEAPDGFTCTATKVNGRLASVTVSADGTVDYQVASAIGIDEGGTASTTTAKISSTIGGGLRPFAVCASESAALEAWIDSQNSATPLPPTDLIIGGPKFLPSNCGENNGNWGMVQFQTQDNGVGNINGDGLAGTIARGSLDETITVDQSQSGDEVTECNKPYETQASEKGISCVFQVTGNPWTNNGVEDAFNYLKTNGIVFNLPVYGDRVDLGGSSTGFPIIGFLEVELLSYCGDPSPTALAIAQLALGACSGGKDNFIHARLLRLGSGTCCDVNKDNRVIEICDVGDMRGDLVSADVLQNCQTGSGTSGPPPSVPDAACTPVSITPASQDVSVDATGRSLQTAVVTLEVLDASDCGTITVDAVGPNTAAGSVSGPSSNIYTATFATGTVFTSSAATYDVRWFDDASLLNSDEADLVTVPLAVCSPTGTPATQVVLTNSDKDAVTTAADVTVTVTIPDPAACGQISVTVDIGGNNVAFAGTGPAASSMTFTLPANTSLPNGSANSKTFDVTIRNGGAPIGPSLTFTTSKKP